MVFWEAEESALTLTRRAHRNDTEKMKLIGTRQIFSMNKKYLEYQ